MNKSRLEDAKDKKKGLPVLDPKTGAVQKCEVSVLDSIRRSKCVVFVATDKNPNVFYECGYAVALDKVVITETDMFSNLP